jgi:hypothetical protein
MLEQLAAVWDEVPYMRFGQFVMNLSRDEHGFADTWEWKLNRWYSELDEASGSWAKPAPAEGGAS